MYAARRGGTHASTRAVPDCVMPFSTTSSPPGRAGRAFAEGILRGGRLGSRTRIPRRPRLPPPSSAVSLPISTPVIIP